jgi:hypothetical protein
MKNFVSIFFVFIVLIAAPTYAQERGVGLNNSSSEKRVALVIGNSAYAVAPLKNPVNDARDMAQSLSALGFEVLHKENLSQNGMKRAIREFGTKIRNGGVGLFYYAGHGVQVKGVNYLIPVDSKVESEEEIEYEAVDAGFVLAQMESAGNTTNIMILDACRNNPFARNFRSASRGLAQMDAPGGTLIAYATAPGSVASDGNARNGIYTQELLKFMRTPNLSIEEVFKRVRISVRDLTQSRQRPWESSSLIGDFYFARMITPESINSSNTQLPPASSGPSGNQVNQAAMTGTGRHLTGTYQLDPSRSNTPMDVADSATRDLPVNERQRVYDKVVARLEAPEMLAIEQRGNKITIASSRAPQTTFEADGRERSEQLPNGVTSRVRAILRGFQLVVDTTGNRPSDFNVTFDPMNDGRTLLVIRSIFVEHRKEPVSMRSMYHKTSDAALWSIYR